MHVRSAHDAVQIRTHVTQTLYDKGSTAVMPLNVTLYNNNGTAQTCAGRCTDYNQWDTNYNIDIMNRVTHVRETEHVYLILDCSSPCFPHSVIPIGTAAHAGLISFDYYIRML